MLAGPLEDTSNVDTETVSVLALVTATFAVPLVALGIDDLQKRRAGRRPASTRGMAPRRIRSQAHPVATTDRR